MANPFQRDRGPLAPVRELQEGYFFSELDEEGAAAAELAAGAELLEDGAAGVSLLLEEELPPSVEEEDALPESPLLSLVDDAGLALP